MEVILKGAVDGLGEPGSIVTVKDGYARNYLIPRDLAAPATSFNVKSLNHQKAQIARRMAREEAGAMAMADRLRTVTVTVRRQVGDQDKLFGSVTSRDIVDALSGEGIPVDSKSVLLDAPIKELGVHDIDVKLAHGVKGTFKLLVDRA